MKNSFSVNLFSQSNHNVLHVRVLYIVYTEDNSDREVTYAHPAMYNSRNTPIPMLVTFTRAMDGLQDIWGYLYLYSWVTALTRQPDILYGVRGWEYILNTWTRRMRMSSALLSQRWNVETVVHEWKRVGVWWHWREHFKGREIAPATRWRKRDQIFRSLTRRLQIAKLKTETTLSNLVFQDILVAQG